MSYEDIKKTERAWAAEVANDLNNSSDKYIVYRESRPITDIKNMLQTSVELYADNVAFMQKFAKDEPYKSITYRENFADRQLSGNRSDLKRPKRQEDCRHRRELLSMGHKLSCSYMRHRYSRAPG